jgi:hypothetical protein
MTARCGGRERWAARTAFALTLVMVLGVDENVAGAIGGEMSHEGVMLVTRTALVIFLIIVGAFFRALVGSGRKRGEIMMLGTLGGMAFGVLVAYLVSPWLKSDGSAVCACLGMTLGWGVSWRFARRIPREASRQS